MVVTNHLLGAMPEASPCKCHIPPSVSKHSLEKVIRSQPPLQIGSLDSE